jgi:two-component sensor histidine kinase
MDSPGSSSIASGAVDSLVRAERHRAKNALQMVSSLLTLQAGEADDESTRDLLSTTQERVRVIALVYGGLVAAGQNGQIEFGGLLNDLVATTVRAFPMTPVVSSFVAAESQLLVDFDRAVALALAVHEMIGDAMRYAFRERKVGKIQVRLGQTSALEYELEVSDDGVERSIFSGSGREEARGNIVQVLLRQVKGRLTVESRSGTRLVVRFSTPKQT